MLTSIDSSRENFQKGKKTLSPRVIIALDFHMAAGKPHEVWQSLSHAHRCHWQWEDGGGQWVFSGGRKVQPILARTTLSVPMNISRKRCLWHLLTKGQWFFSSVLCAHHTTPCCSLFPSELCVVLEAGLWFIHRVDGQKLSILSTLSQSTGKPRSGIPECITSLGPQENLALCRSPGLCGTGNGLVSSPPPLAWAMASLAAPLPGQPLPCSWGTAPHRNCPRSCAQAARAQKPYTGHPWRRDALAGFKQTSPAPRSTVVIRSKKIPSGAVQQGWKTRSMQEKMV